MTADDLPAPPAPDDDSKVVENLRRVVRQRLGGLGLAVLDVRLEGGETKSLVGSPALNVRDVTSPYCQRRKHVTVARLDHFDEEENQWIEAVVEDPHTPVFDQVWFRCDFPEWLNKLSPRNRKIALKLARGETTGWVSRQHHISAARVSQLRRELHKAWLRFHGEAEPLEAAAASA